MVNAKKSNSYFFSYPNDNKSQIKKIENPKRKFTFEKSRAQIDRKGWIQG